MNCLKFESIQDTNRMCMVVECRKILRCVRLFLSCVWNYPRTIVIVQRINGQYKRICLIKIDFSTCRIWSWSNLTRIERCFFLQDSFSDKCLKRWFTSHFDWCIWQGGKNGPSIHGIYGFWIRWHQVLPEISKIYRFHG